jgi:hypothetical protein
MKHSLKYKLIVIVPLLMMLFGVGSYLYPGKKQNAAPPSFPTVISNANIKRASGTSNKVPAIANVEASFAVPLGDDRVLMGASHNVFVGKVVSQIGTRGMILGSGRTLPITQFSVQPVFNIKGNLQGTVTVEQMGGYQGGVLYASGGGDAFGPSSGAGAGYLMQPGTTYLLSTRYESEGVYYLWAFPTASKLVSVNDTLSNAQLQSLAANDERVKELQAAYPNEILIADDVRTNNARNSYVTTHTTPPPPPPAPPLTTNITPPVISNLTSVAGSTSTMTTWTTNKPATSQLLFGPNTAMGENVTPDAALVTNHSILIPGLVSSTTYYYEAQSKDASGTIGTSAQQSFTTLEQ